MRSEPRGDYWLQLRRAPVPGAGLARRRDGARLRARDRARDRQHDGARGRVDAARRAGASRRYPFRLPLSRPRPDRVRPGGPEVQRAVARYHRAERRLDFEDDRTFGEFLGPLPPAVREIFSCAAHRATAELDELSAGCGIGLFALVWGGKGSLIARNLLGGTGRLPAALGRELGERARTGCRVRRDPARRRPSSSSRTTAARSARRHVIVAAQAPHAAPLVAPVAERPPPRSRAAHLRRVPERRGRDERDGARCPTTTSTRWPRPAACSTCSPTRRTPCAAAGPRRPGGSLMLFAGGAAAAALMRERDDVDRRALPRRPARALPADARRRRRRDRAALGARQRLRAPGPRPPAAGARGRARRPREPAPGRRLLRRAGEPWRPPPGPGSRPPNASTPESER